MKYYVIVAVDGYVEVEVEAKDEEDARIKACVEASELDFGQLSNIEWYADSVEMAK